MYQVGGSLAQEAVSYIERKADLNLYSALKKGEFCYVLNSRQMGKSSLLVQIKHRLQNEGFKCAFIDLSILVSENITSQEWYQGIITQLWRSFNLLNQLNLKKWLEENAHLSPLQQLTDFINHLLLQIFHHQNIIIFIDEIDSILSLPFPLDDFFAWIRFCYNQRSIETIYNYLNFAIFGVATPSDLIQDKKRTSFNIGTAIELTGFTLAEAQPLARGLNLKKGNSHEVLKAILDWTNGQPFLTQKLCQLVVNSSQEAITNSLLIPPGNEGFWVENMVKTKIIEQWQLHDEPEHLKTIKNRLTCSQEKIGRLLGLYQIILAYSLYHHDSIAVKVDDSWEQTELILSGLVIKKDGILIVRNKIYQEVFNFLWVEQQLNNLRPYSQFLEAWLKSQKTDESRLLRGQALKDAQSWSRAKSLSDLDYQYLAASEECDRREVQQLLELEKAKAISAEKKAIELQLQEEQKRRLQEQKTTKFQRLFLIASSLALMISLSLGLSTFLQYRYAMKNEQKARISEIKALVSASQGLFDSQRRLDALIEAIKSKRKLNLLKLADAQLTEKTHFVMRQALYNLYEYNRLSGHNGGIFEVDFSPDGNYIITGSLDNTVKIWQKNGKLIKTVDSNNARINALTFSPDSQFFLIGTDGNSNNILMRKKDGTLIKKINAHQAQVTAISYSHNGEKFASVSLDTTVKIWTKEGILLKTLIGHNSGVWDVVFTPDDNYIITGSVDNTIRIWSIDGNLLKTINADQGAIYGIAISPDGQIIASAGINNTVKLWDLKGNLLHTLTGHQAGVYTVKFSPNGQYLASASADKTITIWHSNGTLIHALSGHQGAIWDLAFSPDSKTIVSGGLDNTARLWQIKNPLINNIESNSNAIYKLVFSPDGKNIITPQGDNTIKIWDVQGNLVKTLTGHQASLWEVAVSIDGQFFVSTGLDKTVKIWQKDGTLIKSFIAHQAPIYGINISPDRKIIATASSDNTVKLWNFQGQLLHTLTDHQGAVVKVIFSPNSQMLATASMDKTIKLWNLQGELLHTFQNRQGGIWSIAFSPDGQTLVSGGEDNLVKIWNLQGKLLHILSGHNGRVVSINFSPNGQFFASGSEDNTIKIWSKEGTLLTTLIGHNAEVWGLTFSPDGKILASGGGDHRLILWNIEQILNIPELNYACQLVKDYLQSNTEIPLEDRLICQ